MHPPAQHRQHQPRLFLSSGTPLRPPRGDSSAPSELRGCSPAARRSCPGTGVLFTALSPAPRASGREVAGKRGKDWCGQQPGLVPDRARKEKRTCVEMFLRLSKGLCVPGRDPCSSTLMKCFREQRIGLD